MLAGTGAYAGTGTSGAELAREPVHTVDLSIGSPLLTSALLARGDAHAIGAAIAADIAGAGASVGAGGYGEARAIYTGTQFAVDGGPTGERRTVHLGVDVFAPPGTAVHAPLAGTLAASHDNAAAQDYGPVVLLRHETGDGTEFFTLYGHLSRASLSGKVAGAAIAAGERIGWIGAPPENGDWPPHLHLQVIVDPLDLGLDYPGVAAPSRRNVYLSLSPDPSSLLGIGDSAPPRPLRSREQTLAERLQRIGRNLSISYRRPLKIVRGLGAYLFDDEGRAYLDCVNNVAHVGHCHPRVVAAGARQAAVLNTNTRYLHDSILEYARRLTATLPEPLSVCFFVNSGSEANDLALRLARTATGRHDVIAVDVAYHGHTQALIDISPYKHDGPGGAGRPDFVQVVPMPDPYRGPHRGAGPEAGRAYAANVGHAIAAHPRARPPSRLRSSPSRCSAAAARSSSRRGSSPTRSRWCARRAACASPTRCRPGSAASASHFWAFETQGVVPDIVTMGKPIGNGHPLAVVVTTPAIADAFANGMEYFNTFGGNPVSCEIGLAVLDVIAEERLQENARAVGDAPDGAAARARRPAPGDRRRARPRACSSASSWCATARRATPAPRIAGYVAERMRDHGVLLSTDGPDHNVLKIKPPIVFSRARRRPPRSTPSTACSPRMCRACASPRLDLTPLGGYTCSESRRS